MAIECKFYCSQLLVEFFFWFTKKNNKLICEAQEYIKGLAQDADGDEIDHLKHTLNQLDPESTRSTDIFKSCECLPACSSIQFDAEISQMDIDYVKYSRTKGVERFEG